MSVFLFLIPEKVTGKVTDLVFLIDVPLLTDASGLTSGRYRHDPFGKLLEDIGPYNTYKFSGRRYDDNIGTYDFRSRQYSPKIGRFLQRDAKGLQDSLNLYNYANNNPPTFNDPKGTERVGVIREEQMYHGGSMF